MNIIRRFYYSYKINSLANSLKKEASKHRYIYFLGNKKEIRKFRSVMKHPEMKYPKNYKHDIEIRKIEVDDDKWKN